MRSMFLIASLLIGPACMAGQIYKWVDAQGVTHFGAQPPQSQEASTVTPPAAPAGKPLPPRGNAPIGDQQAIDKTVKKQVAQQQAELKVFCEQARTNLAQLQNNPRVREEVQGEMRRLNEQERQERTAEAQRQISENCS